MTFKHIGTTSFGRVSSNIKCSNDTSEKGCSLQPLLHPNPRPQPALLVCHTALQESMTINYNATIPKIVVGQTVRRSTLTTQFVSSSRDSGSVFVLRLLSCGTSFLQLFPLPYLPCSSFY